MTGRPTPPRYALTPAPEPGGNPGTFEEKQAQWFLELSFFRDVLFRNPPSKGGKGELADAVVLHGDLALMVQVKTQVSSRPPHTWARKAIAEALEQLGFTNRMLAEGHVKTLRGETLGELPFDPSKSPNRWGLIILDQPADPFDPGELVPDVVSAPFPVQVYSLADFKMITERFDTAGDLIGYLEMRDAFRSSLKARVHEETVTCDRVLDRAEKYFRHHVPGMPEELIARTVTVTQRTGRGEFVDNPYGRIYDDIISHMHDMDPALEQNAGNTPANVLPILVELGWLTRARRVALGQKLANIYSAAQDGLPHFFSHFQRPRGIVFVYLATSMPRSERYKYLQGLLARAQAKYDCEAALGMATEPVGGGGRSYDAAYRHGRLSPALVETLRNIEDPFGEDAGQLTP